MELSILFEGKIYMCTIIDFCNENLKIQYPTWYILNDTHRLVWWKVWYSNMTTIYPYILWRTRETVWNKDILNIQNPKPLKNITYYKNYFPSTIGPNSIGSPLVLKPSLHISIKICSITPIRLFHFWPCTIFLIKSMMLILKKKKIKSQLNW